jgi:hypothetical protein
MAPQHALSGCALVFFRDKARMALQFSRKSIGLVVLSDFR